MATLSDDVLEVASLAGKIMLESGGETYRVEQTVNYICRSYGILDCESYATPTVVILSFKGQDGVMRSVVRRIRSRSNNLAKITDVNDLSYELSLNPGAISPAEAMKRLQKIENMPYFPFWLQILASGLVPASFVMMTGNDFRNFLPAMLVGFAVKSFAVFMAKRQINDFIVNLLGGSLASLLSWFTVYLGLGHSWSIIVLGSLMLLLPGLIMVNALRDIVMGDLVSGISRGFEAIFIVCAIAAGAAICNVLLMNSGVMM